MVSLGVWAGFVSWGGGKRRGGEGRGQAGNLVAGQDARVRQGAVALAVQGHRCERPSNFSPAERRKSPSYLTAWQKAARRGLHDIPSLPPVGTRRSGGHRHTTHATRLITGAEAWYPFSVSPPPPHNSHCPWGRGLVARLTRHTRTRRCSRSRHQASRRSGRGGWWYTCATRCSQPPSAS